MTITETTKILSEEDALKFLERDSSKSIGHKIVWERVLEHIRNGEIITFDYKTGELHWFNDLAHT